MGYNKENYRRIRQAYQTKYLAAYEKADERMREVHAKSSEIAAIDRQLSMTGAEIAMAAIGAGPEYRVKLAAVQEKNQRLQAERAALMTALGYPVDYTLPPYECPKCKDTGFIETKMCTCMHRELVLAAIESSGLGALMQTQSFETFDLSHYSAETGDRSRMEYNLNLARSYADDFGLQVKNLLFVGPTGLGKTHLSTAIAKRVIERGFDVYYTTAIAMLADFEHARFGRGEERAASDPTRYIDCELLILDDLGTELGNQFAGSVIYTVINERINLKRPTIINTNLTGREIRTRYSDRIASRILGEYVPVSFVGSDIRLRKIKKK